MSVCAFAIAMSSIATWALKEAIGLTSSVRVFCIACVYFVLSRGSAPPRVARVPHSAATPAHTQSQ